MVYIRGTPLVEWFRGKVREKREKRLRQFRIRVNGWNEAIIMNLNLDWAKLTWWMLRVFGQARGWSLIVRECTISLQIVEVQRNIMCDLWFAGGLFWLKHQGNDWQLGLAPSPTHTFTHATLMHHMRLHIHTFSQANSELHYVALILSINSFISFFLSLHVAGTAFSCGAPPSFRHVRYVFQVGSTSPSHLSFHFILLSHIPNFSTTAFN